MKSSSFSIGLTFYYWEYYKNITKTVDYNRSTNLHNHSGYIIADLYINQKFSTFKEEILKQYYEIIIPKINEYIHTNNVKQSKAAWTDNGTSSSVPLKYGFGQGSKLNRSHLISVTIYTDYTEVSRDFSSSF